MARARHAKPSGLLSRLFPGRYARREQARRAQVLLRQMAAELRHLREHADAQALAAALADERARAAEQRAAAAQAATVALQAEVARLREELLWAWAEGRLPTASATSPAGEAPAATVIDLREASA
jgi:hypothetical protein